jgi:tellurite resistance protein
MKLNLPDLIGVEPERLRGAVKAVVAQQVRDVAAPSLGPMDLEGTVAPRRFTAEPSLGANPDEVAAARHFVALMEAAYLVATSDGMSDAERQTLVDLIAYLTGDSTSPTVVTQMMAGFQALLDREGLSARLQHVAAQFDDFMAREEALSFAALVLIADGSISRKEVRGLIELAEVLGYSVGEAQAAIELVARSVAGQLKGSG